MTAYEDAPFDAFHASPRPFLSLKRRVESEQQKNLIQSGSNQVILDRMKRSEYPNDEAKVLRHGTQYIYSVFIAVSI